MNRRTITMSLASLMAASLFAQIQVVPAQFKTPDPQGRAGFPPAFYLFPDQPVDSLQAVALVDEIGLKPFAVDYAGSITVVNPQSAQGWLQADVKAFRDMAGHGPATNLKVIGLGRGATFVNQQLMADSVCGALAGVVTLGGKAGKVPVCPVPCYSDNEKVAKAYVKAAGGAVEAGNAKGNAIQTYANPEEPLLRVVVNSRKGLNYNEHMVEAWSSLLSRNYRFSNIYHTFYEEPGILVEKYGSYELEPYVDFDRLHITKRTVEKPILLMGQREPKEGDKSLTYLWYEYLPQQTLNAAPKSVPLVCLFHGHGNDPRTQAETSGFLELSAEEGFIVVEMEWQGNGYCAMGLDGIESTIYELLDKYPQIDPSRIYAEGLSAGSMTSNALGIRKSHVFAAICGHSGGIFTGNSHQYGGQSLMNEARQKRGRIEMPWCLVCGTDDWTIRYPNRNDWRGNSVFNAWCTYETLNDLPVITELDFDKDPAFGMGLEERQHVETSKHISYETGVMKKDGKTLIRLVAINHYGHWNFKPMARVMWDFMRHYQRDQKTLEVNYQN